MSQIPPAGDARDPTGTESRVVRCVRRVDPTVKEPGGAAGRATLIGRILLAGLVGLTGCKEASGGETASAEARLEARGIAVYREQACGTCHTLTRAGTGGVFGPSHNGVGLRAEERIHDPSYHGKAKTAEAYLRESVLDPPAYRVPGYEHTRFAMPAYAELSDSDLEALVHMLEAERTPDVPSPKKEPTP